MPYSKIAHLYGQTTARIVSAILAGSDVLTNHICPTHPPDPGTIPHSHYQNSKSS